MKVLYVSKALVVAAYREKLRALAERVEVTAVVPDRWDGAAPEPSPPGVPEPRHAPVWLPGHNHLHVYRSPRGWLDAEAPDLVHVDEEPYSLVTLQLARRCRRRGVPFVFFAWQNLDKALPFPFGRVRARVYAAARGGLAGTRAAAAVLESTGFDGPVAVIPQFGVDPERFAPRPDSGASTRAALGIPGDARVVGYGGRLVAEKGVAVLLDAFAGLDGHPAPHLLLVGDGPARGELERRADALGVRERVHLTGHVPSVEVPDRLAAMDVLVLPTVGSATWTEQFGRILVEAMACGVPVVATRNGEIPDVVGDAGALVPPGDADALRAALARLAEEPGLAEARIRAGRQRVLERFTHARIAAETVDFYREMASRGGSR